MKTKIYNQIAFLLFIFCLGSQNSKAQFSDFAGVLTNENYFNNPRKYLSDLDSTKINSDILIDRSLFSSKILEINGTSAVTTIEYSDFYSIYQNLKYAHKDSNFLPEFDTLLNYSRLLGKGENITPLVILDFNFKKIKANAIVNKEFIQSENGLTDNVASTDSYSSHRAVAFTCFKHNVFGDQINFMIDPIFIFNNQENLVFQSVNVDFGNGQGFQTVNTGVPISVNYSGQSDYIEIKMQIHYLNSITNQLEVVYAHNSVFRQSPDGTPKVVPVNNIKQQPLPQILGEVEIPQPFVFTFPKKQPTLKLIEGCLLKIPYVPCIQPIFYPTYFDEYQPYSLDVFILFNENNNSGKLRKPLIMCDGFDPGNKRDYYSTVKDEPESKYLPNDYDIRGLYHMLDGQRSPWDKSEFPNENNSDMVQALKEDGYDLIFINFIEGAGDVVQNANSMRNLFNEVLNSSTYRDNKTEEFILVGPSMGGLITKLALRNMEYGGEEHYVKTWISLDSPHKGANIPLGLQHNMVNMYESSAIRLANKAPEKALTALKSMAAKQLLKFHFLGTSGALANPAPEHINLQSYMNIRGLPVFSKNYSITNGGTELQYPEGENLIGLYKAELKGATIVDIKIYKLSNGFNPLTYTKVPQVDAKIDIIGGPNALNIENCPGGWHGALYSLNKDPKSNVCFNSINPLGKRFDVTTFIPTASAFGIDLTPSTVQLNWKSFTGINDLTSGKIRTPFDEIYGMTGLNEEHTKISISTRNKVIEAWFRPDFENTTRPVVRTGVSYHLNQMVSKPVAYEVKENITFGGHDNTITFNSTADVNILAGKSINFLPGTVFTAGAKINAKIKPVEYKTLARINKNPKNKVTNPNDNFIKGSLYIGKVYDYTTREAIVEITPQVSVSVYPNPVKTQVNISCSGISNTATNIVISNSSGQTVWEENILYNGTHNISIDNFVSGVYFIKISNNKIIYQTKLLKN